MFISPPRLCSFAAASGMPRLLPSVFLKISWSSAASPIAPGGSLRAEGREAEAQAATIVTTQWNVLEWYLGIYALRMPIYISIYIHCNYVIMYVCMYVWMDGCMDGWMDVWMHACMYTVSLHYTLINHGASRYLPGGFLMPPDKKNLGMEITWMD